MRTKKVLMNLTMSLFGTGLSTILKFISRSVFIYALGKEFLGVSSLFSNILSVLNITELGIGVAIVYGLYKPLAENDTENIKAHVNFLKKAYAYIGVAILLLGLIIMAFLPAIIKTSVEIEHIKLYFLLYIISSASSYWFWSYKRTILQADQKRYIIDFIISTVNLVITVVQIICLMIFKSFLIYIIVLTMSNLLTNLCISYRVDKLYPYLKESNSTKLEKNELRQLIKNVAGVSIYKINSVIVRSTDNIIISAFINTVSVGLYDNYHLISGSVLSIAKKIFTSATASIGNLVVTEDAKKSEKVFRCFSFVSFWLYGFCSICLWVLINPFIELWLDKSFVLSKYVVFLIVLDFLMDGFQSASIVFKDGCGLFWQGKFRPLATAVLNIIISVALAPKMGIAGVIIGTLLSRLFTTWWFEPYMVYKYAFKTSPVPYFVRYFVALVVTVSSGVVVSFACSFFSGVTILNFLIKGCICILLPNLVGLILFKKIEEFQYVLTLINGASKWKIRKGNKIS